MRRGQEFDVVIRHPGRRCPEGVLPLQQGYPRVMLCSSYCNYQVAYVSISPILGDIKFNHLIKVICTRLLLYKVIFSFVINKYFMGRYYQTM